MTQTRTYAVLEVSEYTYAEIRAKLEAAGYLHAFNDTAAGEVIDMHGIALRAEAPADPPADPKDITERLGRMLAEVADATLLTAKDVGSSRNVELRVGSFLPELGERCAALLEEAGY